jgi:hypothetical protein
MGSRSGRRRREPPTKALPQLGKGKIGAALGADGLGEGEVDRRRTRSTDRPQHQLDSPLRLRRLCGAGFQEAFFS